VETTGFYWAVMDGDEHRALTADRAALAGLFDRLARERLADWIAFGEDRLRGTGVRCYLTGGNDDTPAVLEVLEGIDRNLVIPCEHRVVELDGHHTMVTVGYSTPTPWDTPREASEEEIAAAIEATVSSVPDPGQCVFNLHAPPIDSGLDRCLQVDASTDPPTPVIRGGQPVWTVAGSRSVREAIARYQPVAGLHGHVHESPGRVKLGRTQCFNPGSEYSQGVLSGLIVSICDGRVTAFQHTTG
jgi:Icc-related predicted phosphoesterase